MYLADETFVLNDGELTKLRETSNDK